MTPTAEQIRWYRLRRSGLITPFSSPEECATELAGIQAQILSATAISLWNRSKGLDLQGFEELLYKRKNLVKLWGQRGTLHIYRREDWPLIYSARVSQPSWWENRIKRSGGDIEGFYRTAGRIAEFAREKETIGRSDLDFLKLDPEDDLLSPWGGVFYYLVKKGHLCHARPKGGEGRFAHRENWLPGEEWNPPSAEEANIRLARRYFHTYGPASMQDLAYWRGARMEDVRRWTRALGNELAEVEFGDRTLFIPEQDLDVLYTPPPSSRKWPVQLLYRFDPLLLAHKDKSWLIDMEHHKEVWAAAGHVEGTVLVRGRIVASWRYQRKGTKLVVTLHPFKELPKYALATVNKKAGKLACFFGLKLGEYINQ